MKKKVIHVFFEQGTFKDGIAEGLGFIKWPDGSWYDGEIKRNHRHGKGVNVLKINGEPKMCYFGNWKNGKTNGKVMVMVFKFVFIFIIYY